MRRLIRFDCEGETLAGSLDLAKGELGLLFVTGGSQTRIGSHRMYERLAKSLTENGINCFRFDRRGVGDSSGFDPGYLASGPDLEAAAKAFRRSAPHLKTIYGFGLCDGASALALFGDRAGLAALILVNPWLVEAEAGSPPPAAIRNHYRRQLISWAGWQKVLSGGVNYRKLFKGFRRLLSSPSETHLAARIAGSLARHGIETELVLAEADATAVAAAAEISRPQFRGRIAGIQRVASDSHTFARPGDEEALAAATIAAIDRLARS